MKLLVVLLVAMMVTTIGVTYTEGMIKSGFQIGFFVTAGISLFLFSTGMFKGP